MFSVLSILGGAAAFEVRKRVVVTKERKELSQLREDRTELDSLLTGLKEHLSQALNDSESDKRSFEEVQRAAVLLGAQCQSLIKQNARMEEQQEALKEENCALKQHNEELTLQVEQANKRSTEDVEQLQKELEELRDQVKDVVDEFMDGILSRENLHARLSGLGVEVKFIEPEGQKSKDLSEAEDTWILQLRSAGNTIICQAPQVPCSSLTPAEKQLQIQQNKMNASANCLLPSKLPQRPAQNARKTISAADKENSKSAINVRAKQIPAGWKPGAGIAFQLASDSQENKGKGLSLRRPSSGAEHLKWHQNNTYIPAPLPMSELATSAPRLGDDDPVSFSRDMMR